MKAIMFIGFLGCMLCGCASGLPPFIDENVLPLSALTQAINCELTNTIIDQIDANPWLKKWQGQYVITMKANHIGYLRATANTFPIVLPRSSLLNLGVGGGVTGTANRTALFKYNIKFADLSRDKPCQPMLRPNGHPFLTGEIGFKEWMAKAIRTTQDPSAKVKESQLSSVGHTFEFILDLSAGVAPSFVIAPAPNITLNPTANFERIEDNIVDVSFGKIPEAAATVADLERILSKFQKQKIAEEQAVAKAADKRVKDARAELNKRDNKTMIDLQTTIPVLQREVFEFRKAEAADARKGAQLNSLQQKQKSDIEDQLKVAEERYDKEIKIRRAQEQAIEENARLSNSANQNIQRIRESPEEVKVVRRSVPVATPSPDVNPNVTGTILQLQLERLVGSSPVRQ